MNWIKGWPVTFLGIGLFAGGCWLNSGLDSGLIAAGMCIIGAGISQLVISDD